MLQRNSLSVNIYHTEENPLFKRCSTTEGTTTTIYITVTIDNKEGLVLFILLLDTLVLCLNGLCVEDKCSIKCLLLSFGQNE